MSKSVNRSYYSFGGSECPKSKRFYVSRSNKKFKRFLLKDFDFECHSKSIYKKIGGIDWEYRGCRKGSRIKKFEKYNLELYRLDNGKLNSTNLHKPIKYNKIFKVKHVVHSISDICKEYPTPMRRYSLPKHIDRAINFKLIELKHKMNMSFNEYRSFYYYENGDYSKKYNKFIDSIKKEHDELKVELNSYLQIFELSAHECFKLYHRKISKYYLKKK